MIDGNLKMGIIIVISIVMIYLFYINYFKYSYHNTSSVESCVGKCEKYNVHNSYNDKKEAATILQDINKRNKTLIEHLKNKYLNNGFTPNMDSIKNNRIDVIPFTAEQLTKLDNNNYIQERVSQLITNYNSNEIFEISPLNSSGVTSYTQDKKTLILCLRKKELSSNGSNDLHDINTITFVVIHELAHMMNNLWGHKMNFWILFKFMLINSIECGIYTPVDYSKKPIVYCGLLISYNPLFDNTV